MIIILFKILCSLVVVILFSYNIKFPYDNSVFQISGWLFAVTLILMVFSFIWIGV